MLLDRFTTTLMGCQHPEASTPRTGRQAGRQKGEPNDGRYRAHRASAQDGTSDDASPRRIQAQLEDKGLRIDIVSCCSNAHLYTSRISTAPHDHDTLEAGGT